VFEKWFGSKIREPWKKLNWMILFFGGFGSGKSTLMNKIIKGHLWQLLQGGRTDIKQVFGEFDSIMLDENVPETKQQESKLTAEITSSFTSFRELYKKTEQALSFYEYIGGTNPKNKVFLKIGESSGQTNS
jgi:excinuclease UvrABC ATPase subunit